MLELDAKKVFHGALRLVGTKRRLVLITWPVEAWQLINGTPYARIEVDTKTDVMTVYAVDEPGLEVMKGFGDFYNPRLGVMFWRPKGHASPFWGYTESFGVLQINPATRTLAMKLNKTKGRRRLEHESRRPWFKRRTRTRRPRRLQRGGGEHGAAAVEGGQ